MIKKVKDRKKYIEIVFISIKEIQGYNFIYKLYKGPFINLIGSIKKTYTIVEAL